MRLQNLPNFNDLKKVYEAYLEADLDELQNRIFQRYKLLKSDFDVLEMRFLSPFIKSQANLFSSQLNRTFSGVPEFDMNSLNEAEKRAERIYHLFQKAGILISVGDSDPLISDGNLYHPSFKVVTPLQFWHEREWWFVNNGTNSTIIYLAASEQNQTIINAFESPLPFVQCLALFNSDSLEFGVKATLNVEYELAYVPIVEWKNGDTERVITSPVYALERSYINQLTWGLYNGDPKMLNQLILKTDMSIEDTKSTISNNYGKTTKVVKLGIGDEFGVFDTGDLTALKDILLTYKELVEQMALTKGVDVTAVIRNTANVSGESKRFDLGYINRVRNDFKAPATLFDKRIFRLLEYNWGINCGWENIVFQDIDLIVDKKTDAEYASFMRKEGYWTGAESLAYVRQVTVEEAEAFMEKNGLIPDIGQISFDDGGSNEKTDV
jgi:hypothetical protein